MTCKNTQISLQGRIAALFLSSLLGFCSFSFGMSNQDVIAMLEAGISEDTVQLAVKNDIDPEFDVSPEGLIELKEGGVPEDVIQEMIVKTSGGSAEVEEAAASAEEEFPDIPRDKVYPPVIEPVEGGGYYTRINFWAEDGESIATNYSRGTLIPINTEVRLIRVRSDSFRLEVSGMGIVDVENVEKYTGCTMEELLSRYLASEKTKYELYGDYAATHIRSGTMRLGMTKDQVILTRGYPPSHRTPTLNSDVWIYWSSRFVQLTIVFENGRLAEGRGLN